jgi:F420-non-reducing hydrogenase small subunit
VTKPKVAFYWCASCGGCEEAVVDLNEGLLDVVEAVDIVFWPVALDFKYRDVEALDDGELAVTFLNGGIRTSEQADIAELLRAKSQLMVAFGSCSHLGGVPGLANLTSRDRLFETVYHQAPTVVNPDRIVPQPVSHLDGNELVLPEFLETLKTLDQVVDVDYYLPGCAPTPELVGQALKAILEGKLPPKGAVLAPDTPLCDTCPRRDSKPADLSLTEIRRIHQVEVDPERCFLEAGVLCLGMGTRSGCGERCLNANMPCNGCFGPTSKTKDQGAKLLSAVASLFAGTDEAEAERLAAAVADPAGTFYRYGLPASLLRRRM